MNDKTVGLTGVSASGSAGNLSPIIAVPVGGVSTTGQTGGFAVSIDGPTMSYISDFIGKSRSSPLPNGRLMFEVTDQPLQGAANEPNVRKVLAESLSADAGDTVTCRPASDAENHAGVDAYVEYPSGLSVPVQIVKTAAASAYGAAVAKGYWEITVTVEEAAAWIEAAAIDRKTTGSTPSIAPADRAAMILALDVRHAGQLANPDVIASLARQMPGAAHIGFRAIWLVGSTPVGSKRIA
jgi:hypothetical protein